MAQEAGIERGGNPFWGTQSFRGRVEEGRAHGRIKDDREVGSYTDRRSDVMQAQRGMAVGAGVW